MGEGLADSAASSMRLLGADDPRPFSARNPRGRSQLLILGDHAGREIPVRLGTLGLPASMLETHIAWDIGVDALGEVLSAQLDATFIGQRYSRLLIDCNRDPGRLDSVLTESDGVKIPGNRGLSAVDMATRRTEIFDPYHSLIATHVARRRDAGRPTIIFALHSFTPSLGGVARPWRFGVLHLGRSRFSAAVLNRLRRSVGSPEVGDNEPYRMDATDYTVPRHAVSNGLDYVELEVRQDLISDPVGQADIAAMLLPVLLDSLVEAT